MKTLKSSQFVVSIIIVSLSFLMMKPVAAIPAFLPNVSSIPMGESMPIDGVWTIRAINKNIRFEGGRAYAVDDWMHMFVLHIQPDMVVIKNVEQTAPGTYVGDDLPMLSKATARLQANGRINYTAGVFSSELIPVELDYPELMAETLQNLGGGDNDIQPAPDQKPEQSDCSEWAIDPETNKPVCLD